jgi:hypothetical protein
MGYTGQPMAMGYAGPIVVVVPYLTARVLGRITLWKPHDSTPPSSLVMQIRLV